MPDLRDQIPGYAEALAKEQASRNAAFIDITETVCGFELRQMTLRDYLILQSARNPVLVGGTPSPVELVAFLWLLSPGYRPALTFAGWINSWAFAIRCRKFLPRGKGDDHERISSAAKIIEACRAYVEETFQDSGPRASSGAWMPDYWSDGAELCARMGREYGWAPEVTLGLPMKAILQFCSEIRSHNGSRVPLCNPSDRIRSDWMLSQRRN